jgi:lipid A 3-O-deacylase
MHNKMGNNRFYKEIRMIATRYWTLALIISLLLIIPCEKIAFADTEANPADVPNRYGMTFVAGNSYDPRNDITFVQISGFALFDNEKIIPFKAPEALRFKIEGSLGSMTRPEKRLIVSANIISLFYINALSTKTFKPYVEGGIGGIYTDYKFEGQSTKFNFNPQLGIGTEINTVSGKPFIAALRLYHISNAGLSKENRGFNAVTLHVGRFF